MIRFTSFNVHGCERIKVRQDSSQGTIWSTVSFLDGDGKVILSINIFDRALADFEGIADDITTFEQKCDKLSAQVDALQNEINAVEWMNGCIEKELFECRKKS